MLGLSGTHQVYAVCEAMKGQGQLLEDMFSLSSRNSIGNMLGKEEFSGDHIQ